MERYYHDIFQQLQLEIVKGNVEVVGLVCRAQDKYCSFKDGFKVYSDRELFDSALCADKSVDFVVICSVSSTSRQQIRQAVLEHQLVAERCIINSTVFNIECFDFARYASLIFNPVSILSNDCMGVNIYKKLQLQYASPLMSTRMDTENFTKFMEDPLNWLTCHPILYSELDLRNANPLQVMLRNKNTSCIIRVPHAINYQEFCEKYERRLLRVNTKRIFVIYNRDDNYEYETLIKYLNEYKKQYLTIIYDNNLANNLFTKSMKTSSYVNSRNSDTNSFNYLCRLAAGSGLRTRFLPRSTVGL